MANFIKFLQYGYAPDILETYEVTGTITPSILSKITKNINAIIANTKGGFKIGKTGDAEIRVDQIDYRTELYTKMFLLYKGTVANNISDLESYYIKKYKKEFPRKCKNIQMHSGGKMVSSTSFYYLYIVV